MSHINDPKHWRYRAEEARAMAESMTDPEAKQSMLNVAADYERLAKLQGIAEETLRWAYQAKNDEAKQALLDLSYTWFRSSAASLA